MAIWLFSKSWQAESKTPLSLNATRVSARESKNEILTPPARNLPTNRNSAEEVVPRSGLNETKLALPTPHVALANVAPPGSSPSNAPIVKPSFPSVRLQGIFYRSKNPSVMINSKSALVGDKIAGAKVVAITRDSVTLDWNGETKVLTLE
jgi:hypothetical protein